MTTIEPASDEKVESDRNSWSRETFSGRVVHALIARIDAEKARVAEWQEIAEKRYEIIHDLDKEVAALKARCATLQTELANLRSYIQGLKLRAERRGIAEIQGAGADTLPELIRLARIGLTAEAVKQSLTADRDHHRANRAAGARRRKALRDLFDDRREPAP